jgi:hypothetical protein
MSFWRHSVIRMYLVSSSIFVAAGSRFASLTPLHGTQSVAQGGAGIYYRSTASAGWVTLPGDVWREGIGPDEALSA